MVHNLYLIVVVVCRAIGLWWIGRAVFGLILAAVLGRGMGDAMTILSGFAPTLLGGILVWFLAKPIAGLVTKGLD